MGSIAAQRWPQEPERGPAGDGDALQYATLNGVTLAYRVDGHGAPVVFVHGEGLSHELWQSQWPAVAARYFCISYDRRGHGQSEAPFTGYSPAAHAEDLRALLAHLGVEAAHFVVHSRGGAIMLQFLKQQPARVRSVVFADATLPLVPLSLVFEGAASRYREPPPSQADALAQRESRKGAPFYAVARSHPRVKTALERMIEQNSLRMARNPQRAGDHASPVDIGPWTPGQFPDMTAFKAPMLAIVGARTDSFFIEGARKALTIWPRFRMEVIEGADHLLMLEAPDAFNRLLLEFLDDAEGRR